MGLATHVSINYVLLLNVNGMLVFLILVGGDAINNYGHQVLLSIFLQKVLLSL